MIRWVTCAGCNTRLELECGLSATAVQCPRCQTLVDVPAGHLGPGITIGGFEIKHLINSGRMGKVFLAHQLSVDRPAALKVLPPQFCIDEALLERFLVEVRTSARMHHPNIVSAYDAGTDEGIHYLAMQYVDGDSLATLVTARGPLSETDALRTAGKLARALSYGWDQHQLVHRDVKPDNILMDRGNEPYLVDMGIAKSFASSLGGTMAETIMGTPNYMSPEQIEGLASTDLRSDIFSLGATLYFMLTGNIPFDGKTIVQSLQHMVTGSLPDPRIASPTLSAHCVDLLCVTLARKPEARHQSWQALISDITCVADGQPIKAPVSHGKDTLIGARQQQSGLKTATKKHGAPVLSPTPPAGLSATPSAKPSVAPPDGAHPHPKVQVKKPKPPPRKRPVASAGDDHLHLHRTTPAAHGKRKKLMRIAVGFGALIVCLGLAVLFGDEAFALIGRLKQQRTAAAVASQTRIGSLAQQLEDAIAYARTHPDEYETTKQTLTALEASLDGTELAGEAEQALKRIRSRCERARDSAWNALRSRVDALFANGKLDESLDALRDYDGEMARALEPLRSDYVVELTRRARETQDAEAQLQAERKSEAQSELNGLLEALADDQVNGRRTEAVARVREARIEGRLDALGSEWTAIQDRIAATADPDEAILSTFKRDMGRRVAILFRTGLQRLHIRRVLGDEVMGDYRSDTGRTIIRKFKVADLDPKERFIRAGKYETDEGRIRQGLVAVSEGAYGSAAKCFARVNCPVAVALKNAAEAMRGGTTSIPRTT
ncbi:MAG: protein kinase [Kiritimatiellae bacterium]|nr:protein kinase [Kiritimatiellia bacterium]